MLEQTMPMCVIFLVFYYKKQVEIVKSALSIHIRESRFALNSHLKCPLFTVKTIWVKLHNLAKKRNCHKNVIGEFPKKLYDHQFIMKHSTIVLILINFMYCTIFTI